MKVEVPVTVKFPPTVALPETVNVSVSVSPVTFIPPATVANFALSLWCRVTAPPSTQRI